MKFYGKGECIVIGTEEVGDIPQPYDKRDITGRFERNNLGEMVFTISDRTQSSCSWSAKVVEWNDEGGSPHTNIGTEATDMEALLVIFTTAK